MTIQHIAYFIISLIGTGWILHIGDFMILPLIYAVFIGILLRPMVNWLQKYIKLRGLAIVISYISVFVPFILISGMISYQLMEIVDGLPSIGQSLQEGIKTIQNYINNALPANLAIKPDQFTGQWGSLISGPIAIIGKGMDLSSNFMVGIGMTLIYTFFVLLYSKPFKNFIIYQYENPDRDDVKEVLLKVQNIIQNYVSGMVVVIILLSAINTIGLYLIGIEYAVFWGILAGLLAIIPFIGTIIGGLLPFLYAVASTDNLWQPAAVVILYTAVQQIEGNIITPKVIGDKVNVNPFIAICSLIFFGALWGIGGVILALPLVSILRIIMKEFSATRPYSLLMGTELHVKEELASKAA
jgi:predicted PurR-regulated permease PerM